MQINILAGGPKTLWPDNLFETSGDWIGADRGAWWLYQHGIPMQMAVGDFDSLTPSEYQELTTHLSAHTIVRVKAEKDETDTELALLYAQKKRPDHITVFGATGGRIDHLLSNLWLMANPVFKDIVDRVTFVDRVNHIAYALPGNVTVHRQPAIKYLGFMPLNQVENFHIIDAKYPLRLTSNIAKMWSSNEFLEDTVHISFDTGIIMITQTKD